jgi:hypothetical protein
MIYTQSNNVIAKHFHSTQQKVILLRVIFLWPSGAQSDEATTFSRKTLSQIALGEMEYHSCTVKLSHFHTILLNVVLLNVVALSELRFEGTTTFVRTTLSQITLVAVRFTCSYSSTKGYSSECHSPDCRGLLGTQL